MGCDRVGEVIRIVRILEKQWAERRLEIENAESKLKRDSYITNELMTLLAPLYCHSDSIFYRDESLIVWIEECMEQIMDGQLASGCISLVNCNIDSPPDTAFLIKNMVLVYRVLYQSGFPEVKNLTKDIYLFLDRARDCIITGGVHTPNHRWVMCGAMANMYEILGDDNLKRRAFEYLSEGFDMTDYGE